MTIKSKPGVIRDSLHIDVAESKKIFKPMRLELCGVEFGVLELIEALSREFCLNPQEHAYLVRRFAIWMGIRLLRTGEGLPEAWGTGELGEFESFEHYENIVETIRREAVNESNRRSRRKRWERDDLGEVRPTTRLFA